MPNELQPIVDQWYRQQDKGQLFRVVAVDEGGEAIEIQNFDGDIEGLDPESWRGLNIDTAEAPEDWTGPFDDIDLDDLGYSETAPVAKDWRACLESLRSADEQWNEPRPEEEQLATAGREEEEAAYN